jgi:CBS domain containing-hemolysin-like protein
MSTYIIPIIIITALVLLNGLFVAAEFAIIGVRPTRMRQLAEEGNRIAASIQQTLEHPLRLDRYIATAQLGITLVSLGLGMYGEHTIAEWLLGPLEHWMHLDETTGHAIALVGAIALLTYAHVVVGEMVPKSLALQYAERTALAIAAAMQLCSRVFYPAVLVLNAIGNRLLRLMGIPPAEAHGRLYSPEELELVVTESHAGGLIGDNERNLIENIFDFSERRVNQVMTPRTRIVAIPLTIGEAELRQLMATSPYSRFPVYDSDIDHVVGQLLIKDVVRQQIEAPDAFDVKALLRHIPIVPEMMPVAQLLASFKRLHVHLALVVDEYGGTAGLVTLEDLVEEVVGEVRDEFDTAEQPPLRKVAPGVLLVQGELLLEDLVKTAALTLPEDAELPDTQTVGGLIVGLLGRPPRVGDLVELAGATFTIEQVHGMAAETVRVVLPADRPDAAAAPSEEHKE